MTIYIVTTNFMDNYLFGSYSTLLKARHAITDFFEQTNELISCEYMGNYAYRMMAINGEYYWFEIFADTIDAE